VPILEQLFETQYKQAANTSWPTRRDVLHKSTPPFFSRTPS